MKVISGGLGTHIASGSTSLATCWKCTRTDAQIFAFTDHDRDLLVSSILYVAASGYTRTAIQTSSQLAVDNVDLEGVLDSDSITESDLRAGIWDYAQVEIFMVNWADLTQGTLKLRKGRLGQVSAGRTRYTAELRGLTQNMSQVVGRVYGPACDADLGDTRCGVNLATYTVTGSATTVIDNRRIQDSSRSEVLGYFNHGKITFTSGLNDGLSMEVKYYLLVDGYIELHLPMPFDIEVGDTYEMYAGCDKSLTMCLDKFNNIVNNRSFPYIPGTDRISSGGL